MNARERRYLWIGHGLGGAGANLAINAAIAWAMFRGAASVPYWGQQSIFSDTLGTTFFLPFFTCLIVSRICRGHLARGVVGPVRPAGPLGRFIAGLPRGDARRALRLGLLTMAVAGPPAVAVLALAGVRELSLWSFVWFKASFAAALAFFVQPAVALHVLAHAPAEPAPPGAGAGAPG